MVTYGHLSFQNIKKGGQQHERIVTYVRTSHSSIIIALKYYARIMQSGGPLIFNLFNTKISFRYPKLVQSKSFEMNLP